MVFYLVAGRFSMKKNRSILLFIFLLGLPNISFIFESKPSALASVIESSADANAILDKLEAYKARIEGMKKKSAEEKASVIVKLEQKFGRKLICRVEKFFVVLQKFQTILEPLVKEGFVQNDISFAGSVLSQFVEEGAASVQARIETSKGLADICNELDALVSYFRNQFPEEYEAAEAYLKEEKASSD
jgi:hypothetical protein